MSGADYIECKQSRIGGAGRGVFTRKDFSPGEVVVSVDRPLLAELEPERMLDTCGWCFQRGATDEMERMHSASMGLPAGYIEPKACAGCRKVSYCSKPCQARAWKREHKYECKTLAREDVPEGLPIQVRAALKLLGRLQALPDDKNAAVLDTLKFRPFAGPGGLDEIAHQDQKKLDEFNMLAQAAWVYAGRPDKVGGMDGQVAAKGLVINIGLNNFGLSSPTDDVELGKGFDPIICSANHSCEPNAVLVINQPHVQLRALKPIKNGQEVYIRYVDVSNPFSVRQAELKEKYFFSCQCLKCKKGSHCTPDRLSKPPEELAQEYIDLADKELIPRHESHLHRYYLPIVDAKTQERVAALQAEAFAVCADPNADGDAIKSTLQMCLNSGLWNWTRQPVPELCRRLYGRYIESGDVYRGFRLGCKIYFDIAPAIYPYRFDPDHLTNTWALSVITNVLCGPGWAETYKEFAETGLEPRVLYFGFLLDLYDNVPKSFGWDSPMGRVVESTYRQIMAGTNMGEAEIRKKIAEAWPFLETLARSVSVDSL